MGLQPKFVADSMVGTLARRLRMLGVDTLYLREAGDGELKYLVMSQGRILLTRDTRLAGSLADKAWLVQGADVREEFLSISGRLSAFDEDLDPLTRCLECNSPLVPVDRTHVLGRVPPHVLEAVDTFARCPQCDKVYWEGTHGSRMREEIDWMRRVLRAKGDPIDP